MTVAGRRRLVSLVWSVVGLVLIWRGLSYEGLREEADVVALCGASRWIALAIAVPLGVVKGRTTLRGAARRAATHIVRRGERAPWWTAFSPAMLVLVAVMVALGLVLRLAPYDADVKAWVVGILYPAIGVALVMGGWSVRSVKPVPRDVSGDPTAP